MDELVFHQDDHGTMKQVQAGIPFWVELPENPTTGFIWEMMEKTSVAFVRLESRFDQVSPMMTGAAGLHRFQFRIQQSGTYTLELLLKRPWETITQAVDRFSLTVQVQPTLKIGEK